MYDTTTLAPASQPAVTYNGSSNRFLVTWQRVNYELPVVYQIQSRTTSTMGIIGTVVTLANRTTSLTAPAAAVAGNGQFLVVWQGRRNGNDDIYGQRLTASGGLTGGNFVIANSNSAEMAPALVWHSSANAYLVVWQRDGNVWARPFTAIGTPLNPAFAVSTASGAAPAPQMTGDHFQYGLASGTFKFI